MNDHASGLNEWKAHWPLVLTAFLGMSFPSVAYYSMGLFLEPLQRDYGWTRTQFSIGASIAAIITIPMAPFVGALIDRWGVRVFALPGVVLTAASISSFALADGRIAQWATLWGIFALCQSFLKTTVWTAAVMSRFVASRSLAMAVTLCGASFANIAAPPLSRWLIEVYGWRTSYVALAIGWGVPVMVLCALFLYDGHDDKQRNAAGDNAGPSALPDGLSVREALRSRPILRIALATLITLLLTACLVVHQVPLLIEAGVSRSSAAYLASLSGFSAIAGSLISGWLMDRFHAGTIGAYTNAAGGFALLLLLEQFRTPATIVIAMLVIGYASGTKLQLCGYLTSIYAGRRHYGKIFGVMAGIIAVSSAVGPAMGGVIYDYTGSYALLIWLFVPGSLTAAALLVGLGPYPNWGERRDRDEGTPIASQHAAS